ncbi:OTU deubiquitinase [Paramecium bursaria]
MNNQNFQQNLQRQTGSNIYDQQNNLYQQQQVFQRNFQNQANQTIQQPLNIQSNQQRVQTNFSKNDNQQQQNIPLVNQIQNQRDLSNFQNDCQGEKIKKIKILKTRSLNEIMIHLENQRDSQIEPQYRNYLQQDCNIQELIQEYVPKQYQMLEFEELTKELDGYIKVRGDGNCFYNTFIYQYLINVLNKSHDDYQIWFQKFKQVKFVIQLKTSNPFTNEDYKAMNDQFFSEMNQIYEIDTQFRAKQFKERYSINQNYLYQLAIIFCRSVISTCLITSKQKNEDKAEFYDLALQEVSIWEEDCNFNELVLDCINSVLRISIKLFIFEKDLFRIMNYSYDNNPQIYILFRQGHYVIPKQQSKITNTSIVYFNKKLEIHQKSQQRQKEADDFNDILKAELNESINQANQYKKQLDNANKQIYDFKNKQIEQQTYITNLEQKQQEADKLNRYLQTDKGNIQNLNKSLQNTIDDVQSENQILKINLQQQAQQIESQKQQLSYQFNNMQQLQQELDKLKQTLKQEDENKKNFPQQNQQHQTVPQSNLPQRIQIQQVQQQNQNQNSQIQQQDAQQLQFQVQGQNSQNQILSIRIIASNNLNQNILNLLNPKDGAQNFYEVLDFRIALVLGYLKFFQDFSQFMKYFQQINNNSNLRDILISQMKNQNFQDLTNIDQRFSSMFIQYILNNDISDDVNLERFSISINIQLNLINQVKSQKYNEKSKNVVNIACDQNRYYLTK